MTAFENLHRDRPILNGRLTLASNMLHREVFNDTSLSQVTSREELHECALVTQPGQDAPTMDGSIRNLLRQRLSALFRHIIRPNEAALNDTQRETELLSFLTTFANYAQNADFNVRGAGLATHLNTAFSLMGEGAERLHVTFVPGQGNAPARLEVRRGRFNGEGNYVSEGNILGSLILVPQSAEGALASRALFRIARDNILDTRRAEFGPVIQVLNNIANAGGNREQALRQFIDTHLNPYLHHPHQSNQTRGWDIQLVDAGPPIQIRIRQWDPDNNRLVVQGDPGYQLRDVLSLGDAPNPPDLPNNPDNPRDPNTTTRTNPGLLSQAELDTLITAAWIIAGGLGLAGGARPALAAVTALVNYYMRQRPQDLLNRQELQSRTNLQNRQAELAQTHLELAQLELAERRTPPPAELEEERRQERTDELAERREDRTETRPMQEVLHASEISARQLAPIDGASPEARTESVVNAFNNARTRNGNNRFFTDQVLNLYHGRSLTLMGELSAFPMESAARAQRFTDFVREFAAHPAINIPANLRNRIFVVENPSLEHGNGTVVARQTVIPGADGQPQAIYIELPPSRLSATGPLLQETLASLYGQLYRLEPNLAMTPQQRIDIQRTGQVLTDAAALENHVQFRMNENHQLVVPENVNENRSRPGAHVDLGLCPEGHMWIDEAGRPRMRNEQGRELSENEVHQRLMQRMEALVRNLEERARAAPAGPQRLALEEQARQARENYNRLSNSNHPEHAAARGSLVGSFRRGVARYGGRLIPFAVVAQEVIRHFLVGH